MKTKATNTEDKCVLFKTYETSAQILKTLEFIKQRRNFNLQLSVLVKLKHFFSDKQNEIENEIKKPEKMFPNILGDTADYGTFYNPKIGTVFIVGHLASAFLQEINGKPLASLSSGTYSILRGIGANQQQATLCLKKLSSGFYLLILRDVGTEIEKLETLLDTV